MLQISGDNYPQNEYRISPKAVRTVGSMTPIGGTKKAAVMRMTPKKTSSMARKI